MHRTSKNSFESNNDVVHPPLAVIFSRLRTLIYAANGLPSFSPCVLYPNECCWENIEAPWCDIYELFEPRLPAAEEIESFTLHGADFGDIGDETLEPSW